MLVKVALLTAVVVVGYLALFQIRQRLLQRIFGTILGTVLAVFIVVPDLANQVSHFLGIGRGADLIFYFSHVLGAYLAIRIFQRQVRTDERLTALVRWLAIHDARAPQEEEIAADSLSQTVVYLPTDDTQRSTVRAA